MQVKNTQSPNFGMALRITPDAVNSINQATLYKLQIVEKLGEELAETLNVDLELGKDLIPRIVTKYSSAYLPPFKCLKPDGKFLPFSSIWDGKEIPITAIKGKSHIACIKFESKEAALDAYAKMLVMPTELEKAGELTKLMSDEYKRQIATEEEIKKITQEKQRLALELLRKYLGKTDKKI